MGILHKLAIRFLATRSEKIHSEFGDIIVQTTKEIKEISQLNEQFKKLMITWLVSLPWAYFEELFINKNSWNEYLLSIFKDAQVVNGENCALITQSFFLWHLEQLTKNNDNYKKYSFKDIEQLINKNLSRGTLLSFKLKKFKKSFKVLLQDDLYFEYINEIIKTLYNEREKASVIIQALQNDSKLRLGLNIYSTEAIKRAIYIDTKK